MVNPLLGTLYLAPAEEAINSLIKDDPHLADLIEQFSNKSLEVETYHPVIRFIVQFEVGRIRLRSQDGPALGLRPDAKVRAPVSVLVSMLASDASSRGLVDPELEVSGDIELIQALLRALQQADIQWRDLLAATLGDSLSGQLLTLFRAGKDWVRQTDSRFRRNIEDYLKEEIRHVPSQHAAAKLAEQLHDLRLQLDRITARAQELDKRASKLISD
ncbi:MAG: hypothetical protein CMD92_01130 [Gammaproteobacteria bacterium]|nr:hypothetical protein [Gammaproteobacteria bacterium]HBW84720.1 hypothetical protein [Gammaproteobacteria bacterium]